MLEIEKHVPYLILMIDSQIIDYFLNSSLYYNSDFTKFSWVPLEGYKNWEQQSKEDFKGYEFDEENKIVRKKDMVALKFSDQINLLLSKDLNSEAIKKYEELYNEWGFLLLDESETVP